MISVMYLRRYGKKAGGEEYGYWSLVESVRTARGPRQRVVASIGKLPGFGDIYPALLLWQRLGFIFPMFAGNRSDVLKAYKIYYMPKLIFVDRNQIVNKIVGHYILEPELHDNMREIMGR